MYRGALTNSLRLCQNRIGESKEREEGEGELIGQRNGLAHASGPGQEAEDTGRGGTSRLETRPHPGIKFNQENGSEKAESAE